MANWCSIEAEIVCFDGREAEINYEETGCFIYGYFSYKDGILYDTYLPESCFPDYDEETYYEQLDELLSTNSQTKIICQI